MARRRLEEAGKGEGKQPVLRRARRGLARTVRRTTEGWKRLLELPWVWVALLLTVGAWGLTPGGLLPVPEARVGEIASRDYVAPSDLLIPDEETTHEKK
jgi:hypothetical protein